MDILKTDIINRDIYDLLKRLNAYSPSTYQHSLRVSALCYNFGRRIGLGNEELEKLKIGGLLHDIGKLMMQFYISHQNLLLKNIAKLKSILYMGMSYLLMLELMIMIF